MCEQCMADTKTFGEVVPGWWLVQARIKGTFMGEGDWGLARANDPDVFWPAHLIPRKDPTFEFTDDQLESMTEEESRAFTEYQELITELETHFNVPVEVGHHLVNAAMQLQYSQTRHGARFLCWLFHRMAIIIERNPEASDEVNRLGYFDYIPIGEGI